MQKPHYDVIIATPGISLDAGYVRSLTQTLNKLNSLGITSIWINEFCSLVNLARELTLDGGYLFNENQDNIDYLAKGPLRDQFTYNKIFLIDSDISWEVDQFLKLYNSDLDVVSGVYITDNGRPSGWPLNSQDLNNRDLSVFNEIVKAEAFGLGFVAVKNGVFESISRPWFQMLGKKMVQTDGSEIEINLGEDVSWCHKVKDAGFTLHWDFSTKVQHAKIIYLG